MENINDAKRLVIVFNEETHRPEYRFEGRWIGSDATLASRKLWKAYKDYLLEKRRVANEVEDRKAKDIAANELVEKEIAERKERELEARKEKEVNEAIAKAKETDNAKRTKPARAGKTISRFTRVQTPRKTK